MVHIERLDRTLDIFACRCDVFMIHEGKTEKYHDRMENFCTSCGVLWTRIAHIPRIKPYIRIRK